MDRKGIALEAQIIIITTMETMMIHPKILLVVLKNKDSNNTVCAHFAWSIQTGLITMTILKCFGDAQNKRLK